jgi:hypothetical protein
MVLRTQRSQPMRPLAGIGVLLIVLGLGTLAFHGFTLFTYQHMVDAGPFKVDVEKPDTITFYPIVGAVAVVAGALLIYSVGRSTTG